MHFSRSASPTSSNSAACHEARPRWVWWTAARPATLPAGAVPVMVGSALALAHGRFRADVTICAVLSLLLLQVGANLFNDFADFGRGADTAARLGPARATQRGWLTARQVLAGAGVAFFAAALLGGYLLWACGPSVLVMGGIGLATAVLYTGGPYPLGYHGLGEVAVLACMGLTAVGGTYFLQAGALPPAVLAAGTAVGLLACAILGVNNLRDRVQDAHAGKHTLAVRLGPRRARLLYVATLAAAFAAVAAVAVHDRAWGWLLPWACAPLAVACVRRVLADDGARLNPLLGQTARLEGIFGLLLCVGVLL